MKEATTEYQQVGRSQLIVSEVHNTGTVDSKGRKESYRTTVTEISIEAVPAEVIESGRGYSFCYESFNSALTKKYCVAIRKMKNGELFGAYQGSVEFEDKDEALAYAKVATAKKVKALQKASRNN